MQLRATDGLAILAAVLIVPFFFTREQALTLVPVTSALRIYGDVYYSMYVRSGLAIGTIERAYEEKMVEMPHLLLPIHNPGDGNNFINAVMLTGLQRAMSKEKCYNTNKYLSPYQQKASVLTVNRMRPAICKATDVYGADNLNHLWQYEAHSVMSSTGASGYIKHLVQEGTPTLSDWRIFKKRMRAVNSTQYINLKADYSYYQTRRHITGVTDTLDVFLFSKQFKLLWVNKELGKLFQIELDAFSTFQITSHKVTLSKDNVYVSAVALSPTGDGLVLLAALSITSGATLWINTATIPSRAWSTRMLKEFEPEWLLSELDAVCEVYNASSISSLKNNKTLPKGDCSIDEKKARKLDLQLKISSWEILRRYLQHHDVFDARHINHQLSHGISHYITTYEDDYIIGIEGLTILALRSPTFIAFLDGTTGEEVASFTVMPGVLLEPGDNYGEIFISYLSDHSIKHSKNYDLKYYDYIRTSIINGTITDRLDHLPLSEQSSLLAVNTALNGLPDPIRSLINPLLHVDDRLNTHMAFFLTPGGIVYAISTSLNTVIWRTAVSDFVPTSLNSHMSIQRISSTHSVLVLTLNTHLYMFDLYTGKETVVFRLADQDKKHVNTTDLFYDDEGSRVLSAILFGQMHPQDEINTVFLTSGPFLDIVKITPPNEALVSYWERASVLLFTAAIFISALRIIPALVPKDE